MLQFCGLDSCDYTLFACNLQLETVEAACRSLNIKRSQLPKLCERVSLAADGWPGILKWPRAH